MQRGDRSSAVKQLQIDLTTAGYPVSPWSGFFGPITEGAVRRLQAASDLLLTGVADTPTLAALKLRLETLRANTETAAVDTWDEVRRLPVSLPVTPLDRRISDAVRLQQRCDGGQGCRYGGWIDPYYFDSKEFDAQQMFVIPRVGRIVPGTGVTPPVHGGTCSPWAGLILGWYLSANHEYNFRIGRSAWQIANFDHDEVYKNTRIPGYDEYCEVEGKYRLEKIPLSNLYRHWEWLNKVNMVEMEHHCILVLKVGGPDGLMLEDPYRPGQPMGPGLARWAADGFYPKKDTDGDGVPEKFYSGTKQTFRLIGPYEGVTQGYDVYRVSNVDTQTCSPVDGPWKGRQPWPLVLA